MPKRIQRKRTKGWKMPEGAVYVGRGSKWGNPFRIGGYFRINVGAFAWIETIERIAKDDPLFTKIETTEHAVAFFRTFAAQRRPERFEPLRGKTLACWCPLDRPCHADVLLELANAPTSRETAERAP